MRRFALVPLVLLTGILAGCSQVTHVAGDALGIPVEETCTTLDGAYDQYQSLIAQGGATEEQVAAARDELVASLNGLADDVDGQLGDLVRSGADQLSGMADLQSPETIEAIEQLRDSVEAFCG
jgi:hypothetical protein